MIAAAVLLVLSIAGLLALVVVLAVAGGRGDAALPRRRPRPYPGCPACEFQASCDAVDAGDALEHHQAAEHTGGIRW